MVRLTLCLLLLAATACNRSADFRNELRSRAERDGLALICVGNPIQVTPLGREGQLVVAGRPYHTPGAVHSWICGNGQWIAWSVQNRQHTDPLVVDSRTGKRRGQLSGPITNVYTVGISLDGSMVAFAGTRGMPRDQSSVRGLMLGELATGKITIVLPTNSAVTVSWAPDSRTVAYSHDDRIFFYDVNGGSSRAVAAGSNPSWSPDSKVIAFKTPKGDIALLDPVTLQQRNIVTGRALAWAIDLFLWSPDGRYLIYPEEAFAGTRMIAYRMRDGATVTVQRLFKTRSEGYYCIPDYKGFLTYFPTR